MEDNIQTIIVVIISAFLLFVFPVYMAYEKKDDISYALAMRYTQDLVDEVRSKGYITKYMYDDYRAKLKVTGNSYDIQMTHEYNRYDPITNYYKIEDNEYILVKTTTQEERVKFENDAIQEGINIGKLANDSSDSEKDKYLKEVYEKEKINKVEDTYKLSKETYTTDHIVSVLNSERKLALNSTSDVVKCSDDDEAEDGCQYAYIMNVDDNFNVIIKNTNITPATIIYNMVTANTLDDNTRIYVNYGGAILASKWYKDIDYSKMKHDNLSLNTFEEQIIFLDERQFLVSKQHDNPIVDIVYDDEFNGSYVLDFDVLPEEVTELRQKGTLKIADYTGYNFAAGNSKAYNTNNMMSISVGMNGISLITNTTQELITSASHTWEQYKKIPIEVTTSTTCKVKNRYVARGENGEEIVTERYDNIACSDIVNSTQITDYSNIKVQYASENKFELRLTGRSGVRDVIVEVTTNTGTMLQNLNYEKSNPSGNLSISGNLNSVSNGSGTSSKYYIDITNNSIKVKVENEERTKITDYSKVRVKYIDSGKLQISLTGKTGIPNYVKTIDISGDYTLLKGLDKTIENPVDNPTFDGQFQVIVNARSTAINYHINLGETFVAVSAEQSISEETTILSYPVTIDEYVNVRIEFSKVENTGASGTNKYIAVLYIDDERVDESIEMTTIPKVDSFGRTFVGSEERFFEGKIKNAKIYIKTM